MGPQPPATRRPQPDRIPSTCPATLSCPTVTAPIWRCVAAVEKGLEKLAKPLFSIRAMEVFRDESDLAASSRI
ncbi:MAG: hypothetical protein MZW92_43090 [Comamonadaceae bacterium]|nr:hypothetical protein [Comamonadaceae bacterium]